MIVLERTDDVPLTFDGTLAAEASSDDGNRVRWTELRLWALADPAEYVLETVGVSTVEGEKRLCSAVFCPGVSALLRALRKSDASRGYRNSYITALGWRLLTDAVRAGVLVLPESETV